jgi:hypothetical protein
MTVALLCDGPGAACVTHLAGSVINGRHARYGRVMKELITPGYCVYAETERISIAANLHSLNKH